MLTGPSDSVRAKIAKLDDWQATAWEMYRTVGELRFGVTWLANALSRVNLVPAVPPTRPGDEPQPLDLEAEDLPAGAARVAEIVADIAGGPVGQGQLLAGIATHMMLPGICYLLVEVDEETDEFSTWSVLSQSEMRSKDVGSGLREYQRKIGDGKNDWMKIPDSAVIIKVWRQDREYSYKPDSPVRSVIGVLEQIRVLDDHVKATAESRLAGNGLLALPVSISFPEAQPGTVPEGEDPPDPLDSFMRTLNLAWSLPIVDRSVASARVPVTIQVPDDVMPYMKDAHIDFSTEFDAQVQSLRDAAIKRLALGIEMPPEVLLGVADVNHWTAWQVDESLIKLAVEPMAEVAVHALTTGYLSATLKAEGIDPAKFMVWYDTTDLKARPDLTAAATAAYDRVELSGAALRRETGLSDDDMPDEDEQLRRIVLKLIEASPAAAAKLLVGLGLLAPGDADAIAEAEAPPAPAVPGGPAAEDNRELPEGQPDDGEPPSASALVAACDGLVDRALERAGARLRSAAGRNQEGGAGAVACEDVRLLHTTIDATRFATLDSLLDGAWKRAAVIGPRYGIDPADLTRYLDAYTRALLTTGHAHDVDRLAAALGLHATV